MPVPDHVPFDCALDPAAVELRVGIGVSPPPPAQGKAWFGTPVGDSRATDNFGLVWNPGEATAEQVDLVAESLEASWDAFVVHDGWAPPPGSESFLVWVVLDPHLGVDGLTIEVPSPDLPMGYVVIHLDPTLGADPEVLRAAAAHELVHALQHRQRGWSAAASEAWFWEATASWGAARALPGNNVWLAEAEGLLRAPQLRYDSAEDGHDRGMVLLARWLEDREPGTVKASWDAGRSRPGEDWAAILADTAGVTEAELWGDFAVALGNGGLPEADRLPEVAIVGELVSGSFGDDLPRLGIELHELRGRSPRMAELSPFSTDAELSLAGPAGAGEVVVVTPGERLAVVGLGEVPAGYQLFLSPVDAEPEPPEPAGGVVARGDEVITPSGCGCATGSDANGWLAWLVAAAAAATARATTRPCRTRSR